MDIDVKKEYQFFQESGNDVWSVEATSVCANAYVIESSSYKAHFTATFECLMKPQQSLVNSLARHATTHPI